MIDIEVHFDDVVLDLAGKPPLQAEILERAVQQTLAEPVPSLRSGQALNGMKEQALAGERPAAKVELTLVVTGDEALQELNRRYLEIDAPTDVLSFPAGEVNPESGALYLGDIAISYPCAQAQAAQAGHPVAAEMQLLVVHGVLHLLGYDHAGSGEKAAMWEIQDQVLEALGSAARSPR